MRDRRGKNKKGKLLRIYQSSSVHVAKIPIRLIQIKRRGILSQCLCMKKKEYAVGLYPETMHNPYLSDSTSSIQHWRELVSAAINHNASKPRLKIARFDPTVRKDKRNINSTIFV
jgi:hypothetical protein